MNQYNGVYRGEIAAVQDDEVRLRYRVRVATVHHQETVPEHLPQAEICTAFAAPGAGDLPHFEIGDRVWVMFENADVDYPVILGGWIAKRNAVEDLPTSMTADYGNGRRRWTRHDRAGNMVEMSEVSSELHLNIRSGNAQIRVRLGDDGISIEADGPVRVVSPAVEVQSTVATVEGDEVIVHANGRNGANPDGRLLLVSNKDIHLHVRPAAEGGTDDGVIAIGQYRDSGNPTTNGVPAQHQSPTVNVYAKDVNIGALNAAPALNTQNVNIKAANSVRVESSQDVNVVATKNVNINATENVEITGAQEVKIMGTTKVDISSSTEVSVDAPQINIG